MLILWYCDAMQKQHGACRLFLEPESFDDVASAIFQSGSLSRNDFAHTECRETAGRCRQLSRRLSRRPRFLAEPVGLRLSFVRFLKSRHEHRRLSDTITSNRISPHGLQRTIRNKSTNVISEVHTWPSETCTSNPHTDRKSSSQFQNVFFSHEA